jgi:hypothetical protein
LLIPNDYTIRFMKAARGIASGNALIVDLVIC